MLYHIDNKVGQWFAVLGSVSLKKSSQIVSVHGNEGIILVWPCLHLSEDKHPPVVESNLARHPVHRQPVQVFGLASQQVGSDELSRQASTSM